MRVIAGKYKRTPLNTLEGEDVTRPTRDMVKEALFSTITVYSDTKFLDLFAGSGAIGIEALSRGAEDAVFNDINKDAVKIIEGNLSKLNENRMVLNLPYEECIKRLKGYRFDYIYIDPPYIFNEHEKLFSLIEEYDLLNDDGIAIAEVNKSTVLNEEYNKVKLYKEKKYGINKLYYYKKGDLHD
ncbi:MAG: 16S rRNA (guanine(966)-N(2))-methyltransferase RsmD [Erysipelotrichaceae bacterium]|nr:16S rRNA (guanine(966)-N(2))-methyltransferase RsmD [Erysipelotrichaceae bacterium]